ncbi:hypothetical protein BGX27_001101 [Mortierella sp. AM989]|nr:hypothetical protein BGX27_001101 [Mortierella sp. AM989]
MKLAIEQANLSLPVPSGYCVGAVLVQETHTDPNLDFPQEEHFRVVATGYSRELPGNTHAEECCLLKLAAMEGEEEEKREAIAGVSRRNDVKVDTGSPGESRPKKEWIMYSTMEPCSERLSGSKSCSDRLIESDVRRVYVGVREPDHFVRSVMGVEKMVQNGIEVVHIPGFEEECLAPNQHILRKALPA